MKIDMHVHSIYSLDGRDTIEDIIKQAKKIGLDGIAITDHNEIKGALKAYDIAKKMNFKVIRGIEISSSKGHILGFGINEKVPRHLSPQETIEFVEDMGGIAVCPHPYRFWSGIGYRTAMKVKFCAIETMNSRSSERDNERAKRLAEELNLPKTGGSDAHTLDWLGRAVTVFKSGSSEDDFISEIKKNNVSAFGESRPFLGSLQYTYKCTTQWMRRGFKRM